MSLHELLIKKESSHLTSLRSWPSSLETIGTHPNHYLNIVRTLNIGQEMIVYTMSCWLPVCESGDHILQPPALDSFVWLSAVAMPLDLICHCDCSNVNLQQIRFLSNSMKFDVIESQNVLQWLIKEKSLVSCHSASAHKRSSAKLQQLLWWPKVPLYMTPSSFHTMSFWLPVCVSLETTFLKMLVCPYEEVSSSLETIGTHLHQYLDTVCTRSTGLEILLEFHPMCSCTLWRAVNPL